MRKAGEILEDLNKFTEEKNRFDYEPKAGDLVVVYGSGTVGSKNIFGIVVGPSEEKSYYGKKQVALKPLCDTNGDEIKNYNKDENGNILVPFDQIKPDSSYFEKCAAKAARRFERFEEIQKGI